MLDKSKYDPELYKRVAEEEADKERLTRYPPKETSERNAPDIIALLIVLVLAVLATLFA